MQKVRFSIRIEAPKEKVWKTMLADATYREWTSAFGPGSHYKGEWKTGARIRFLAPDAKTGALSGMLSTVKEARPYDFISLEHYGMVHEGVEDTESPAVKAWAGALEDYTFKSSGQGTELIIEQDLEDSYLAMFQEMWPKALQRLKEAAERTA